MPISERIKLTEMLKKGQNNQIKTSNSTNESKDDSMNLKGKNVFSSLLLCCCLVFIPIHIFSQYRNDFLCDLHFLFSSFVSLYLHSTCTLVHVVYILL